MTPAQKKAYNEKYYREHSNYWKDFYSKGRLVGRHKNIMEGNGGVKRRGEGLGTGPVGSSSNKKKRSVDATGAVDSWANLVSQTADPIDSYAYNLAMDVPNEHEPDWDLGTIAYIANFGGGGFYQNLANTVADAHGLLSKTARRGKSAVRSMLNDWRIGAKAVKSLFRKKGR